MDAIEISLDLIEVSCIPFDIFKSSFHTQYYASREFLWSYPEQALACYRQRR